MNHATTALCLLLLITLLACTKRPTILVNGLTRSAFDMSEIFMAINIDSLGTETRDTLLITTRIYDDKNNVIEYIDSSAVQHFRNIYDWEYDDLGLLRKLKTWSSRDSSEVETFYHYIDTVLQSVIFDDETEDFIISCSTNLTYYGNGSQKTETTNYSTILKETQDTSREQTINFYDRDGSQYKTRYQYLDDPDKNKFYTYEKRNHMISKIKEYDSNDSLISVIDLEYELDSFQNWVTMKSYENNKLVRIGKRTINYR